ncbi:PIN domain-containing protein [Scopulibacillus cellulosilyticus]|uniref:PIN domain-containing protein n=1 Tax=Scopulibacillus cellulosilyticus TaxID=2665665 RepID=A0ABW2PZV6_9BACL
MDCFWVDTNIIISFLIKRGQHSIASKEIMQKVQDDEIALYLSPIVAAECCFILRKVYKKEREEIANILTRLFEQPGFLGDDKRLIIEAIGALKINSRISFEDAYIAATAKNHSENKILTYNERDFKKLGVEFYTPDRLI